jgi:hypothetical protein
MKTEGWKLNKELIGTGAFFSLALIFVFMGRSYLASTYSVEYGPLTTSLSILICVLGLLPLVFFMKKSESQHIAVPFLVVWGAVTVIQYGYRPLVFNNYMFFGKSFLNESIQFKTLVLTFFALCLCYLSYYFIKTKTTVESFTQKINLSFNVELSVKWIFWAGIIGNVAYAVETVVGAIFYTFNQFIPAGLQQPIHLLAGLPIIAVILLLSFQLTDKISKKQVYLFWGLVFMPRLILGVLTGISFQVIGLIIPVIFVFLTIKRKIPFGIITLFFVLFAIFQGLRSSNLRKNRDYFSGDRYKQQGDELWFALPKDMKRYVGLVDRLGAHNMLGKVLSNIPENEPFYKFDAMGTAVFALIPRAIWNNKPSPVDLREFGHRIGVFSERWAQQSNNLRPTQLGMLYVTWGVPAIIVGMLLFGALYAFIEGISRVDKENIDYGKLLLGIVCATNLIDIEGDCFSILARTIWPALLVVVICLAIRRLKVEG